MGGQCQKCVTLPQLSHQEGGRVAVVAYDVAEGVSNLSVTEFLRQIEAEQHGTIQVGRGFVLLRGRGADDLVGVVHAVIIGTGWGDSRGMVDTAPTVHARPPSLYQLAVVYSISTV